MVPVTPHVQNPAVNRDAHILLRPEVHAWAMERPTLVAAGLTRGMTVVDLGCGSGRMTPFLRAGVGPTGTVIGLDVDADAIAEAKARDTETGDRAIRYEVATAYDTGLDDDSVDFVVARQLFGQLTDPARALAEIRRILKPGGKVMLLDSHDGLLWLEPRPAGHAEFMARAAEHQRMRGGDREIGAKLAGLLAASGFAEVVTDVHVFDTYRLPADLFVALALEPVAAAFNGDDAADAAGHLEACTAALVAGQTHGSAGFYATWATLD